VFLLSLCCAIHFTSFGALNYTPSWRRTQPYECLLNFDQFFPHVLEYNNFDLRNRKLKRGVSNSARYIIGRGKTAVKLRRGCKTLYYAHVLGSKPFDFYWIPWLNQGMTYLSVTQSLAPLLFMVIISYDDPGTTKESNINS
jgi:hypothetical protein